MEKLIERKNKLDTNLTFWGLVMISMFLGAMLFAIHPFIFWSILGILLTVFFVSLGVSFVIGSSIESLEEEARENERS